MRRREWIIPAVVGLAVASVAWNLPTAQEDAQQGTDAGATAPATVAPFGHAAPVRGDSILWVVREGAAAHDVAAEVDSDMPCAGATTRQGVFFWLNSSADCPAPEGPRLMEGGHDAVRLSAYAFLADGTLAASSEDDLRSGRFPRSSDYVRLPDHTWYLGAGPPPEGTTAPPPALEETLSLLWPLLAGATEGGIRSTVLEQHPHAWSTGPLWVTVRVDAVVSTGS